VVSTGRCNTGLKFLCWRMVLQGLSWALVKLACDSSEFALARLVLTGAAKLISEENARHVSPKKSLRQNRI
jgi:hypothetical protein